MGGFSLGSALGGIVSTGSPWGALAGFIPTQSAEDMGFTAPNIPQGYTSPNLGTIDQKLFQTWQNPTVQQPTFTVGGQTTGTNLQYAPLIDSTGFGLYQPERLNQSQITTPLSQAQNQISGMFSNLNSMPLGYSSSEMNNILRGGNYAASSMSPIYSALNQAQQQYNKVSGMQAGYTPEELAAMKENLNASLNNTFQQSLRDINSSMGARGLSGGSMTNAQLLANKDLMNSASQGIRDIILGAGEARRTDNQKIAELANQASSQYGSVANQLGNLGYNTGSLMSQNANNIANARTQMQETLMNQYPQFANIMSQNASDLGKLNYDVSGQNATNAMNQNQYNETMRYNLAGANQGIAANNANLYNTMVQQNASVPYNQSQNNWNQGLSLFNALSGNNSSATQNAISAANANNAYQQNAFNAATQANQGLLQTLGGLSSVFNPTMQYQTRTPTSYTSSSTVPNSFSFRNTGYTGKRS